MDDYDFCFVKLTGPQNFLVVVTSLIFIPVYWLLLVGAGTYCFKEIYHNYIGVGNWNVWWWLLCTAGYGMMMGAFVKEALNRSVFFTRWLTMMIAKPQGSLPEKTGEQGILARFFIEGGKLAIDNFLVRILLYVLSFPAAILFFSVCGWVFGNVALLGFNYINGTDLPLVFLENPKAALILGFFFWLRFKD